MEVYPIGEKRVPNQKNCTQPNTSVFGCVQFKIIVRVVVIFIELQSHTHTSINISVNFGLNLIANICIGNLGSIRYRSLDLV